MNWQTNQIAPSGIGYDSYGNVTTVPAPISLTLGYDVANRPTLVNGSQVYAYDSGNSRVYYHNTSDTIYLYGANGRKLATYTISAITDTAITLSLQSQNLYFAGKLVTAEGNSAAVDGLESVRWSNLNGGTSHRYYPYGVEYHATTNDTEKYATYTRDALTGLDYAMNRYYSSIWGRFLSADLSWASVNLRNPQSWNRYQYAQNDPVGRNDPGGMEDASKDAGDNYDYNPLGCTQDGGGGGPDTTGAGSFTSGDITGTQTSGFGVLTDANGNPVPLPVIGDPELTNSDNTMTVASDTQELVPRPSSLGAPSAPAPAPPDSTFFWPTPVPGTTQTGKYSDYLSCAWGRMLADVDEALALTFIGPAAYTLQTIPPPMKYAGVVAAIFGFAFNAARGRDAAGYCSALIGVYIGGPAGHDPKPPHSRGNGPF